MGSISIDENLMDAANIVEWKKVQVLDITNESVKHAIKHPKVQEKYVLMELLHI